MLAKRDTRDRGKIDLALDELSHELDALQMAIIGLQGNLSPILDPRERDEQAMPGPSAEPGQSPFLNRIVTARDIVVLLKHSVGRTIERIEL
jgi:hypothetical protein